MYFDKENDIVLILFSINQGNQGYFSNRSNGKTYVNPSSKNYRCLFSHQSKIGTSTFLPFRLESVRIISKVPISSMCATTNDLVKSGK